jgi:hypothetical protein
MAPVLSNQPDRARRPSGREIRATSRSRPGRSRRRRTRHAQRQAFIRRSLALYVDGSGSRREVVARRGFAGSVLVVDRDAETHGDRRLVAHLGADEPLENAAVACRRYLEDGRMGCCRRLTQEDLRLVPFAEEQAEPRWPEAQEASSQELCDRNGRAHRLELVNSGMSIPELRWRRLGPDGFEARSVSVREAVAALESYEPVRALSRSALALHGADPDVSVTVLRAELERVLMSPIVLNRALREAVIATVQHEELSMSEIAIRCGRVKRDSRGNESGETSWLARRLGMLPEGGHETPTPWVHSDVLALIARRGLGISPREVEL